MTSSTNKPSNSAFILAFAAIYVIWGSTYLGIRVAVESIPPLLMAGIRFLTAGTLMLVFLKTIGHALPTRRQWLDSAVTGAFLLLGGNGVVAWAEQTVPSGIIALGIGIQPIFIVLTEWAWPGGQRPTAAVVVGMILGFIGLTWLAAPWETAQQSDLSITGLVAIVIACLSWSIGSIYGRHAKNPPNLLVGAAAQMVTGALALFLAAAVRGEFSHFAISSVSSRSWWAVTYLVTIGSWVGFSTFVWLMRHSTPARVATYAYVNPIVAIFLGWLILDEPVSPRVGVSATIIILAVVIVTTQKGRKAKQTHPLPLEVESPARSRS